MKKTNPDFETKSTGQQKSLSQPEVTESHDIKRKTHVNLFVFLLRLPDLLWLRRVAQRGAPAPAAECSQQQKPAQRQEKQRRCCGKRTGAFLQPRKDQSVLKIDQLYLPYLHVQAEPG